MTSCSNYATSSTCYAANINSATAACVWKNNQCSFDTCSTLAAAGLSACAADSSCVGMQQQSQVLCFSMQRACSMINSVDCQQFPWCLKTSASDACYYYEPGQGIAGQSSESCLSFPSWSIAIIVLWILIMIILGGIILLAVRQRRLDAIAAIEDSDDVYVENVKANDSTHALERPLNDDRF